MLPLSPQPLPSPYHHIILSRDHHSPNHYSLSQTPSLPIFSCVSSLPPPLTSVPPVPSTLVPLQLPSHLSSPPQQVVNPPPTKRQKKTPATTQDSHSQEFLKIQLNLAQTKITSQDAALKRKEESISILTERLRLLELGINSHLMSQYFPTSVSSSSVHPTSQLTVPSQPPGPYQASPPPSSAPQTSCPGNATTATIPPCHMSSSTIFNEIKTIKQEVSEIRADVSSLLKILKEIPSSSNPNCPTSSTSKPGPLKTSRHTQTHPQTKTAPRPSLVPSKSGSSLPPSSNRPIRPLFPPCPWETGVFPPVPVRYLGPPRPTRPRSRSSRRTSPLEAPPQPTFYHSSRANPSPSQCSSYTTRNQPVQPLITVVLDEDDDDLAPAVSSNPDAPSDYNSLNF